MEGNIMHNVDMLMLKEGIRGADLCRATGISPGSLTDWRKGRSKPKLAALQKIADYFGVSIETITGKPQEQERRITMSSMILGERMDENPMLKQLCTLAQHLTDDQLAVLIKMAAYLQPKAGQ